MEIKLDIQRLKRHLKYERDLRSNRNRQENVIKQLDKGEYTAIDSELEDGFRSFFNSFRNVLPESTKSLKEYIENILKDRKGQAIGVEFGGPGVKAFSSFSPGFFKTTVGVSILGNQDVKYRDSQKEPSTHSVLQGDIFLPNTYKFLREKLSGFVDDSGIPNQIQVNNIDFILSRIAKGLDSSPIELEPIDVKFILKTWYKLLNPNGIMLVQMPILFNFYMPLLAKFFNEKYLVSNF